ncbi:hypothetical protein ACFWMR_07315 [Amycolatopsis thailandensis]|uniref:hypothetical protein n=1 Tax=Amycolatopsis thailandensis TaxID=589330 RepID=UPI0036612683
MPKTPSSVDPACGHPMPPAEAITMPQVLLSGIVLTFTGWMISRGFGCHVALLISSGSVTVGSGLAYVPRGITRVARALGQQS